jgi:hypothetical protein
VDMRVVLVDRDANGREFILSQLTLTEYGQYYRSSVALASRALAGEAEAEETVKNVLGTALDLAAPAETRIRGYLAAYILKQAFDDAHAGLFSAPQATAAAPGEPAPPPPSGCPAGHSADVKCVQCAGGK